MRTGNALSSAPILLFIIHLKTMHQALLSLDRLHAGRDELALLSGIALPATGKSLTTVLLGKLPHTGLQLGPEVADEALNRPGKSFAES